MGDKLVKGSFFAVREDLCENVLIRDPKKHNQLAEDGSFVDNEAVFEGYVGGITCWVDPETKRCYCDEAGAIPVWDLDIEIEAATHWCVQVGDGEDSKIFPSYEV
jgi:hypothetical protein